MNRGADSPGSGPDRISMLELHGTHHCHNKHLFLLTQHDYLGDGDQLKLIQKLSVIHFL